MKLKKALFFILALAVVLSGCDPMEAIKPSPTVTPSAIPAAGGFINLPVCDFDTWNPLLTKSESVMQVDSLVYEGLMKTGADLSVQPCLAQSVSVSADGLSYTFSLRQDISWHDGSELTARDVDYTVRTITAKDSGSVYQKNLEHVASSRVTDRYTYVITLKEPMSGFLDLATFPIIKENTSSADEINTYLPMGTGPYKYASGGMSKVVKFKANGSYWTGKPANVDEIVVKILPDQQALTYAFEAREIDATVLEAQDLMTYAPKASAQMAQYTDNDMSFLGINSSGPVLGSGAVRRAISAAIDREELVKDIMFSHAQAAALPVNPSSWLYDAQRASVARDAARAVEWLEADGWIAGADGIRTKQTSDGAVILKFTILVNEDNVRRTAIAQSIKKYLADIGMDVTIQLVEYAQYQKKIADADYDMFLGEVELPRTGELGDFAGKDARYSVFKSEELDNLLLQVRMATSAEQRKEAFRKLSGAFADNMPIVTLFFGRDALMYSGKIKGEVRPVYGGIYSNLMEWYANEV